MEAVVKGAAEILDVMVEAEAGSMQVTPVGMVSCHPLKKQNLLTSMLRPYIILLGLIHAPLKCVKLV